MHDNSREDFEGSGLDGHKQKCMPIPTSNSGYHAIKFYLALTVAIQHHTKSNLQPSKIGPSDVQTSDPCEQVWPVLEVYGNWCHRSVLISKDANPIVLRKYFNFCDQPTIVAINLCPERLRLARSQRLRNKTGHKIIKEITIFIHSKATLPSMAHIDLRSWNMENSVTQG